MDQRYFTILLIPSILALVSVGLIVISFDPEQRHVISKVLFWVGLFIATWGFSSLLLFVTGKLANRLSSTFPAALRRGFLVAAGAFAVIGLNRYGLASWPTIAVVVAGLVVVEVVVVKVLYPSPDVDDFS